MDPTNINDIAAWIGAAAPGAQLASDSRRVRQGDVFFAYPGEAGDGRAFIGAAIEQGAAAIVCEARGLVWDAQWNVPHLGVPDLKKRAGPVAHAYYAMPDSAMYTVGVTGTNGKTSCALWLGQAFAKLGQSGAVIGTLGVGLFQPRAEARFDATGYTTPDAVLLARTLA
ncbi:MAG: UDP-N-acetylmuramoyl-L-alanyl-D-glutamate--2,6-diaminopimelate ligase, partial [Burkholderiaceae bacterium]|nr:UDP-N-acetylmuramoyl-L-alanyl-D-glutamate--2,6-diaminopimelate ligase [Burkholderiaceae bacterium]